MKQRVSGAKTTGSLWVGWNLSQASLITPDSSVPGVETSRVGGAGWRGGWGGGEGTDSEVKTKNKCRNSSRLKKPERNVLASADVDQAQVLWERLRFFFFCLFFWCGNGHKLCSFPVCMRDRFQEEAANAPNTCTTTTVSPFQTQIKTSATEMCFSVTSTMNWVNDSSSSFMLEGVSGQCTELYPEFAVVRFVWLCSSSSSGLFVFTGNITMQSKRAICKSFNVSRRTWPDREPRQPLYHGLGWRGVLCAQR